MGLFNKDKKAANSCCCGNAEELIVKENSESKSQMRSCGCGCGEGGCEPEKKELRDQEVVIKVLGSGCKNCITLGDNVKKALEEMKLEANIVKVTDFADITGYGVMSTPALVVNEKVVSYGKVLKPQEVRKILEKVL